jgi:nitrate reductase NapAB chaperone NapD
MSYCPPFNSDAILAINSVSVQRCDLDDGTIIVQIEDTQLRAYKGTLTSVRYSERGIANATASEVCAPLLRFSG